ncbi:MAG: lysylphosphatidylglycerol synthase transmembrane domain-containing protein [Actinomycetia bacterium]|nr:lysylphosphatidylglycerol synthase transmembrane domain-containing protein [Actinomycetes bacterium]
MPDQENAPSLPGLTRGTIVRTVLGIAAAIALLGWALPTITGTSWGEIIDVLSTVPYWALGACFALALAFLYAYALTLKASLPGLTHWRAMILNTAGTAVSKAFPGGGAVGLAATILICRTWGFPMRAISTSAVVTGVWNTMTRVALPVLAIALLAISDLSMPRVLRQAAVAAAVTGVIVIAVFTGIIWSARVAEIAGGFVDRIASRFRKAHRPNRIREAMTDTRSQIIERVRASWHWLTLGMIGFFAAQYGIFLISLHVTGIQMGIAAGFAAFAIGRLLTAVGITPGGIGITETGTAAALVALGAPASQAGAAVVLMAIFTNIVELPLGILAWVAWVIDRRQGERRAAEEFAAEQGTAAKDGAVE